MPRYSPNLLALVRYMAEMTSSNDPYDVATIATQTGISQPTVRRLLNSNSGTLFGYIRQNHMQNWYFMPSDEAKKVLNRATALATVSTGMRPGLSTEPVFNEHTQSFSSQPVAEAVKVVDNPELAKELIDVKQQNIALQTEVADLKRKLEESERQLKIKNQEYNEVWRENEEYLENWRTNKRRKENAVRQTTVGFTTQSAFDLEPFDVE